MIGTAKEAMAKVIDLFESTHWTSGNMVEKLYDPDGPPKTAYCAIGGLRYALGFTPTTRPGTDPEGRVLIDAEWDEWAELLAYRDSLYSLVGVLALRSDSLGERARDALSDAREDAPDMSDKWGVLHAFGNLEDVVVSFNDGVEFGGKDGVINLFKEALTKEFPAAATS